MVKGIRSSQKTCLLGKTFSEPNYVQGRDFVYGILFGPSQPKFYDVTRMYDHPFNTKSIELDPPGSCIMVYNQRNCSGSKKLRVTQDLPNIPDGFDRIGSVSVC